MKPLRTRLYLKPPGSELISSELEVHWPTLVSGEVRGLPKGAILYQCEARFPGVLPANGFVGRSYSTLEALLTVLASTKEFCREFEKSGGKIYGAMADDESTPDLSEPIRPRDFFDP